MRYQQPQGSFRANLDIPLAEYLTFLTTTGAWEAIGNVAGAYTAGQLAATTLPNGVGWEAAASTSLGISYAGGTRLKNTDWTFVCFCQPDATYNGTDPSVVFSLQSASDGYLEFSFYGNHTGGGGGTASFCAFEYKSGSTRLGNYADSVTDGAAHVFVATRSGTTTKIYVDGVDKSGTQTVVGSGITRGALVARTHCLTGTVDGHVNRQVPVFGMAFFDGKAASAVEVKSISDAFWQLYDDDEEDDVIFLTAAASGPSSVSESMSASDSSSAIVIYLASIAEAGAMGESGTANNATSASINESGALADNATSALSTSASATEAGTLIEASSGSLSTLGAQTETVAVSESASAATVTSASQSESVSVSELASASALFSAVASETASAAESSAGTAALGAEIAESATASDSSSTGAATIPASVAESVSLADVMAAGTAMQAAIAEAMIPIDSQSLVATLSASIAEAIALTESSASIASLGALQIEVTALMADGAAACSFSVAASEVATLTDIVTWVGNLIADPKFSAVVKATSFYARVPNINFKTIV